MKKLLNYIYWLLFVYSLAAFVSACASAYVTEKPTISPSATQTVVAESTTVTPQATSPVLATIPYSTISEDVTSDLNCRITINFFFSFKKGFDIQAYRNLFVPSNQPPVNTITPPIESLTILALMPASEWWQKNFPATPIPGNLLSEGINEHIYYVEFTGHYESYETPFYAYPDFMIMTMVTDESNSCKIKNYGKG